MKHAVFGVLAALAFASSPGSLSAKPRAPHPEGLEQEGGLDIKARSSTARAQTWLASDDNRLRERALKRLGTATDAQGVQLLIRSVQPNGKARTPRLRLVALRSLARFLDDAAVRRALVTLMSGAGLPPEAAGNPLETLVRESAAMALAASGSQDALMVLGKSLRQGGPTGTAAARALVAYPPKDLAPLLTTPGAASTNLVDVLGSLGDQRAFNALRSYVTRGSPEVRARATVVLTELGHMETVTLARHWLSTGSIDRSQRLAATRVLAMARTDDAAKYLEQLLNDENLATEAVRLSYRMPDPRYVPALGRVLKSTASAVKPALFAAIGRAASDAASELLESGLTSPAWAADAAYALALTANPRAEEALERGLARPATRRLCSRALTLRMAALGTRSKLLEETLHELLEASDPSDRAAGAFGLSALDAEAGARLLRSDDPAVVIAAARNAHRGSLAIAAARRLAREEDPTLSLALSNALADPEAEQLVPSAKLHALIQSGSAAASLAARALGTRFASMDDYYAEDLLHSASPQLRAEFMLGLGRAKAPLAMGLLTRAYEFETNRLVRRAIVCATSERTEATRRRILDWAGGLDPDTEVRELALLAASGQHLLGMPPGNQTFWLKLETTTRAHRSEFEQPVVVQGQRGHTLVALADPDGFVGIIGLDTARVSYLLAEAAD